MIRQLRTSERFRAGVLPEATDIDQAIERSSDIAVVVDEAGVVSGISVNTECPTLGCLDHWVGRPFADFLTDECVDKFETRARALRESPDAQVRPIELNHIDNAKWEFPIRYTMHRIRGGETVLLLGRDLQPFAEVQQRLVREQMAREREQQRMRGIETYFRVVLEASETPLVLVDPEGGKIRDLNTAAAQLLGSTVDGLSDSGIAQAFEGRRRTEFLEALKGAASTSELKGIEAVARRNGRVVTLLPEFFRAAGDLVLLCRVTAIDDQDVRGPEFTQSLASLFASTTDAIVLTDAKGVIREANEAFLVMTDAAQLRDVKDQSLGEFLMRGTVDLTLILENAIKTGRIRSYMAQIKSVVGTRLPVDISAAHLRQRGGDLGIGLIIRDVSQEDTMAAAEPGSMVSQDAVKNVMDLVGTASLKELVSATSDVVEKMCIETAIQMTGNNRVAAAEMLGLSRQSLYVKLRKHGLLHTGGGD